MNNESFNQKLKKYFARKLNQHTVLNLGTPSEPLQKAGFFEEELQLSQSILTKALKQHEITADTLQDLFNQIHEPLMVFNSATQANAKLVISESNKMPKIWRLRYI